MWVPRNIRQRHHYSYLPIRKVRHTLRHDAKQFQTLDHAVIGRPISLPNLDPIAQVSQEMQAAGVAYVPKQSSLVHLRRQPSREIIHKYASNPARIRETIRSVGGSAVMPEIVVSRSSLELIHVESTDTTRTFMLHAYPIRAHDASKKRLIDLREEQYALSCGLGDFYADDPELWFGKIEGPAKTDAVEDFIDTLEGQLPTTLSLGKVGIILATQ